MYPLETLNEIFPSEYRDDFYSQFYDGIKAWQHIIFEFLAYSEGIDPKFPDDDFSKLAKRFAEIERWPYPLAGQMYKSGDFSWLEVSHRIYWDQLECLPPAKMAHDCFMVGEPWAHNEKGAVYTAFVEYHNRYFCRHDNACNFSPIKYKLEIQSQFDVYKKESNESNSSLE